MVYDGKPSKGCASCRKRKIKCDQTRPTCLQCQRAQFTCPGYRDMSALYFRDQSQDVSQRAQRRHAIRSAIAVRSRRSPHDESSALGYPSPASTHRQTHDTPPKRQSSEEDAETIGKRKEKDKERDREKDREKEMPGVSRALDIPVADQSIRVFLHNYVPSDATPGVHLTSSQIVSHATSSEAVRHAISAIGLAILANMRQRSSFLAEARTEYAQALRLTNQALRNRDSSLQDTNLNAVILLGMFEVMSCGAPKSLENWQKHIAGAAAFLELWDPYRVRSATSIQLFTQLRTELMANCLRTQTRVPHTVRKLSQIIQTCRAEPDSCVEELVRMIAEVSDLLADARDEGIADPMEAIGRARDLDTRLQTWSLTLPPRWQYALRVAPKGERNLLSELAFNDYYYVYQDLWACNIWSYYRNSRILLNLLMRDRLLLYLTIHPYPEWRILLDECRANLERQSVDILLTVPFSIAIQFASFQRGHTQTRPGGCLGGYYILWPLYVAASAQTPGNPLRDWAASRLEYIGNQMGIGQALLMARVVRGEIPQEALSIYDYCNSYPSRL